MSSDLLLPWTLGDRIDDFYESSPTAPLQDINMGKHGGAIRVVVRMGGDEHDYAPGIAAVKLIAAAPELLDALKAMFALHEPEGRFQPSSYKPILRQAREAIAKATGQPVSECGKKEYEYHEALLLIANGATGYADRDTDLANIAKRALDMEVE